MPSSPAFMKPSSPPPAREDEIQEVSSPRLSIPPIVSPSFVLPFPLQFTVSKKASGISFGDFSISCPLHNLLFMVSGRGLAFRSKRVLLNGAGIPLLCATRKLLSLYDRWDAFRGDQPKPDDALFTVKRSAYFQLKTSLNVFLASAKKDSKPDFKVKGNYFERKCTVFHGSEIVAEVKRKFSDSNALLSKDTFTIDIQAGTDHAFIVALVVIMDEIHRENDQSTVAPTGAAGRAIVPDTGRSAQMDWN